MIKNIPAREVRAGYKLRGQRITEVTTVESGYRIRISTLYDTVLYGSEAEVQVEV